MPDIEVKKNYHCKTENAFPEKYTNEEVTRFVVNFETNPLKVPEPIILWARLTFQVTSMDLGNKFGRKVARLTVCKAK